MNMEMRIIVAVLLFFLPGPASAAPVLQAARATQPPVIDGQLDDPCWQIAKPASDFRVMNTANPATNGSQVRFCFDDANLYIAVRCDEPNISSIDTKPFARDFHDVFRTDHVEIMLDPGHTKNDYFHIGINASGTIADRTCTQGGHIGDFSWDANITGASHIGKDNWSCELAIPFYSLGIKGNVDSTWRVNVCRQKMAPKQLSSIGENGAFNIAGNFVQLRGVKANFKRYSYAIGEPNLSSMIKDSALELSLRVDVKNETGQAKQVLLDAWLISPDGQVYAVKKLIDPATDKETSYSLGPMTLTEQGEYVCHVRVADALTKKTLAVRKTILPITFVPAAIRLIEPWYRHAIFSTQHIEKVVLDLEVNMDPAALKSMSAKVWIEEIPAGKEHGQVVLDQVRATQRVTFDVDPLPEKKMRIVAMLTDKDSGKVVRIDHPLRKLAYKKGEVWLGKDMQWRVDGKPFFLNGAWNNPEDYLPQYNAFTAEKPGDTLLLAHGIMNELWYKAKSLRKDTLSDEDTDMCRAWAAVKRDHPKMFAYYVSDEPEVSNIKAVVLERVYQVMSDEDPYHPIIISNNSMHGLHAYGKCADINGLHPYPVILKDKPINDIGKVAIFTEGTTKYFANSQHKQTVAYLHQGFNYGDYGAVNNRIPNYVEYRSQNLLAIICGANGILHFNRMVKHYPELYIGMEHLAKECAYLGPRVIATTSSVMPEASSDKLKMLLKNYNGELVLFACNVDAQARDVTITLPGSSRLNVISEDRTITVASGKFEDHFEPWEVHVYTTGRDKSGLLTVKQINKLIDDANQNRRKPGNLAFQMFEGDGVVVSASTNYASKYRREDCGLWHVVDGIVDTLDTYKVLAWQDTTDNQSPDWLEIKLPKQQKIGRVVVYPFEQTLKDYAVQAYLGGAWKNVDKVTGQKSDHIEHKFKSVMTDRIRLLITATHGKNARVTEVEIYEK